MIKRNMWNSLKQVLSKTRSKPIVISRSQHSISRSHISPNAVKVLYRLNAAGFAAYLVGGSVRDLLINRKPKDFDVATNARPEQVRSIFKNSRIIGRRFRLVHVYYEGEVIEVSTFRAPLNEFTGEEEGIEDNDLVQDENVYGTIEEDAWRRDFTINALYYNIADFSIVDYTGGMADLKKRVIRMIGDPVQRYHEDPVRLLRAIRLSAKLNFKIERNTEFPIKELTNLLMHVPSARLYDEILKLFFEGNAFTTYQKSFDYGLIKILFPLTVGSFNKDRHHLHTRFIEISLSSADDRFHSGRSLNPGFLFAILLWPALQVLLNSRQSETTLFYVILHQCIYQVIDEQKKHVMIPRRMIGMIRSIWVMQYHFKKRRPSRVPRILKHRYFRAALDFLEMRALCEGSDLKEIAVWWRSQQRNKIKEH